MDRLLELIRLDGAEKAERGLIHTPSEIFQQPRTWGDTFLAVHQQRRSIEAFLVSAGIRTSPNRKPIVFLIGAGTSDYIGHALTSLLQQKWQCESIAVASTDLLTNLEDFVLRDREYLWISFSRSGDSPEGVAVLERALENCPNVSHLIVTCNPEGKMARTYRDHPRVFCLVLNDAVNDRGLAMTSSFSNMVVCGQTLANLWRIGDYEPVLQALATAGESLLQIAPDHAARLAERPFTNVCFAGSGALKAIARESALKVSELTAGRIWTMSESILGLRHGPLAALNEETLFVCFVSSDPRRRKYELDLLREIGSKGVVQTRVAVGPELNTDIQGACEVFISLSTSAPIPDSYRPPLDVIFGQLLGLFFSLRCGLRPDAPSPNGVINRVVQNVAIH